VKKVLLSIIATLLVVGLFAVYFKTHIFGKSNNLDSQAKCATQAQKTLSDYQKDRLQDFTQQNHYNKNLNKCFVLISYVYIDNISNGNGEVLFDAYENNELASYTYTDISGKHDPSSLCLIGKNNGFVSCQKYKNFVNQRMEEDNKL